MKRLLKTFENTMAAVAFAEAGEAESAREILLEERFPLKKIEQLKHEVDLTVDDLTSMAITFAEAGEFQIALGLLKEAEDNVKKVLKVYEKKIMLIPKMSLN